MESFLSVSYPELLKEISFYLGFGRDLNLTPNNLDLINSIIRAGIRQFYYPPLLPGENHQHIWSFLKPTVSINTVASDSDYDLPDDCGGIEGNLTFSSSTTYAPQITVIPESKLIDLQNSISSVSGKPYYAAVRPKVFSGNTGQRLELLLYPTPDTVYTLYYKKIVLVSDLSVSAPYPYGGSSHGETILNSCLSVAEKRLNDTHGVHFEDFMRSLQSSIERDRRVSLPDYLGTLSNNTDVVYTRYPIITINE